MKKVLLIILLVTAIFTITSCNTHTETTALKITSTIFPYYSFASEIFGNDAEITMLIKPGAESHTYDPTPQDILNIYNSDIFIYTGGESDKWVETILKSVDKNKTKIIKAMDVIDVCDNENNTHSHNEMTDEHVWTSPQNAIAISKEIYSAVNNEKFRVNLDKYVNELNALDNEFRNIAENTNKTLIFADRFPFSYFIQEYDFNYLSAFTSCSEEAEPSSKKLSDIIEAIKKENITSIFYIEFSNQKIADTISDETGAKKLLFHSCHNITLDELNSDASYLTLMKQNLNNLKEATR